MNSRQRRRQRHRDLMMARSVEKAAKGFMQRFGQNLVRNGLEVARDYVSEVGDVSTGSADELAKNIWDLAAKRAVKESL